MLQWVEFRIYSRLVPEPPPTLMDRRLVGVVYGGCRGPAPQGMAAMYSGPTLTITTQPWRGAVSEALCQEQGQYVQSWPHASSGIK